MFRSKPRDIPTLGITLQPHLEDIEVELSLNIFYCPIEAIQDCNTWLRSEKKWNLTQLVLYVHQYVRHGFFNSQI